MRMHPGSSPSLPVISSSPLKNWNRHVTAFSWVLLHHVHHRPAHRRALKVALTTSHLFVCPLRVPTTPGHYPFISCHDIANLEHTLTFSSVPLRHYQHRCSLCRTNSRPSSPQHQACLFDAISPTSDVHEGTPVSEVSLPSPSRSATTAHQSNLY